MSAPVVFTLRNIGTGARAHRCLFSVRPQLARLARPARQATKPLPASALVARRLMSTKAESKAADGEAVEEAEEVEEVQVSADDFFAAEATKKSKFAVKARKVTDADLTRRGAGQGESEVDMTRRGAGQGGGPMPT